MLMIAVVFIDIEKVSRKQCYDDETKTEKMGKSIVKDKMTGLTHSKCSDEKKSRKGLRCCAGPSLNMSLTNIVILLLTLFFWCICVSRYPLLHQISS